jgi:DNA polymerase-4
MMSSSGTPRVMPRIIAHVDLDAFFASVEQRDNPALRGKPVLVGGSGRRGVVAAASYEARAFGCRSAQPMAVALRHCPAAVVVKPSGPAYREASKAVFAMLDDLTPLVQPLSIDEAFLDLTGIARDYEHAERLIAAFRARVRDSIDLTISAGIAPNKFIAKLASDEDKPDGLTVIRPALVETYLRGLPIERMWGIGKVTAPRYRSAGLITFADLIDIDAKTLARVAGRDGERLRQLARGDDDRPVVTDRQAKSYSQERTFGENIETPDLVLAELHAQVEHVAWRIRRAGRRAKTITLKIRHGSFQTVTRSMTFDDSTDRTDTIWHGAQAVFEAWAKSSFVPVRLIGFGITQVDDAPVQGSLFVDENDERQRRLDHATDVIAAKFGESMISRGLDTMRRPRAVEHESRSDPFREE